MLLKMKNGGMLNITTDEDYSSGCETCDYGSCYTNYFDIELTTLKIHIESRQMYEYPLSEGAMMKVLLHNVERIKYMPEEEFSTWLIAELQQEVNCDLEYNIKKR